MSLRTISYHWSDRCLLWIAGMLLLCLTLFGGQAPVQAAVNSQGADSFNQVTIETKLEAEVLQIIRNHPEVVLESLQAYQRQQEERLKQVQNLFVQQLKDNPKIIIDSSPTTGSIDSKIVLLEFSDFQCPFCAKAEKILNEFVDIHQDEVTLVYKNFPLAIHPEAIPAAKAAWAANQQGKFWEYHNALFENQDELSEDFYLDIAENLNLDLEKFQRDRNSKAASDAIQKDIEMAQRLGISGTPFLVMNGKIFAGAVPLSTLESAL